MSNSALKLAIAEESNRRVHNLRFLDALTDLVISKIARFSDTQIKALENEALQALSSDILMIEELNQYILEHPLNSTWSLKTNKNKEIFACARSIVQDKGILSKQDILQENYPVVDGVVLLGGAEGDVQGTSALNCLHTYFITILYLLSSASSNVDEAKSYMKVVFRVQESPIAQTTMLPEHVISSDIYPRLQDWLYFYKDEMSPEQGELLFTTLGYAYGGSRQDSRYHSKSLRAEDCSSAVAKWVGSKEAFSTYHMKQYYNDSCDMSDPYCKEVERTLLPFTRPFSEVTAGMIYVFANKGHTGIVAEIISNECFRSLSYNRDLPNIEGLGYGMECITSAEYLFFSVIGDLTKDVSIIDEL